MFIQTIETIAKKIPGVRHMLRRFQSFLVKRKLEGRSAEEVFTSIYKRNEWRSSESVSGSGSELNNTKIVTEKLPALFRDFGVKSLLDIPCGDFNWMRNVDLDGINYLGADVVEELVADNKRKFQKDGISFKKLDLLSDALPKVDLIFTRDCFVHFSFNDLEAALQNICQSDSTYLLTTNFTKCAENKDILTGQWRALNLHLAPFFMPPPIVTVNEDCPSGEGRLAAKSLSLWKIDELKNYRK